VKILRAYHDDIVSGQFGHQADATQNWKSNILADNEFSHMTQQAHKVPHYNLLLFFLVFPSIFLISSYGLLGCWLQPGSLRSPLYMIPKYSFEFFLVHTITILKKKQTYA
jgi:hypothetical protein